MPSEWLLLLGWLAWLVGLAGVVGLVSLAAIPGLAGLAWWAWRPWRAPRAMVPGGRKDRPLSAPLASQPGVIAGVPRGQPTMTPRIGTSQ